MDCYLTRLSVFFKLFQKTKKKLKFLFISRKKVLVLQQPLTPFYWHTTPVHPTEEHTIKNQRDFLTFITKPQLR